MKYPQLFPSKELGPTESYEVKVGVVKAMDTDQILPEWVIKSINLLD